MVKGEAIDGERGEYGKGVKGIGGIGENIGGVGRRKKNQYRGETWIFFFF